MKKIETLEDRDKKDKRRKTIIGIILAVIMLLSVAGFAVSYFNKNEGTGTENSLEKDYNGIHFNNNRYYWITSIQGQNFAFTYLPQDTENISLSLNLDLRSYIGKPLYFVNGNAGATEIAKNIERYVLRMQEACYEKNCTENLPVKNCSDNLIIFRETTYTKINNNENCTFIDSPGTEAVRVSDAFLYRVLGIR